MVALTIRTLLAPLLLASAAAAVRWPRCQPIDYVRYLSAKEDSVTGRIGYGPRGFYVFHKDWKKDGDPCLFLDIMATGFAAEHPLEHNFFMYLIQYDVDAGIERDGWLGDAAHMRDTAAVLGRIGRIKAPEGFYVIQPMGPEDDPKKKENNVASEAPAERAEEDDLPGHTELKKRGEAAA